VLPFLKEGVLTQFIQQSSAWKICPFSYIYEFIQFQFKYFIKYLLYIRVVTQYYFILSNINYWNNSLISYSDLALGTPSIGFYLP
jgi:hypothetical protein